MYRQMKATTNVSYTGPLHLIWLPLLQQLNGALGSYTDNNIAKYWNARNWKLAKLGHAQRYWNSSLIVDVT
jgi:hypothetical protein